MNAEYLKAVIFSPFFVLLFSPFPFSLFLFIAFFLLSPAILPDEEAGLQGADTGLPHSGLDVVDDGEDDGQHALDVVEHEARLRCGQLGQDQRRAHALELVACRGMLKPLERRVGAFRDKRLGQRAKAATGQSANGASAGADDIDVRAKRREQVQDVAAKHVQVEVRVERSVVDIDQLDDGRNAAQVIELGLADQQAADLAVHQLVHLAHGVIARMPHRRPRNLFPPNDEEKKRKKKKEEREEKKRERKERKRKETGKKRERKERGEWGGAIATKGKEEGRKKRKEGVRKLGDF